METAVILQKQNLKNLKWSKRRNSSGTAGTLLKAYSELGGKKYYYKLSSLDAQKGITGNECINEIIADRLLTILGVNHIHYQLIRAEIIVNNCETDTLLCVSENFRDKNEEKIALDLFYELAGLDGEDKLSFIKRYGWEKNIYEMLVIDFLILNRDRHGANIEVLKDTKTGKRRLAPLYDHGLSLLCSCHSDSEAEEFDVMKERKVNSYFGGYSAYDNLELIPDNCLPSFNTLKENDREVLFDGLNGILSKVMQDKIWEMIYKRWNYYEDFCNKKKQR